MKKTKVIKKLALLQEVIRTLTSAELKTAIGGLENGGCGANTSSIHSKGERSPTTC